MPDTDTRCQSRATRICICIPFGLNVQVAITIQSVAWNCHSTLRAVEFVLVPLTRWLRVMSATFCMYRTCRMQHDVCGIIVSSFGSRSNNLPDASLCSRESTKMHECCFLKSLAIDFCMTSKWRVAVNEIAILKRVSSVYEAEILFAR
jgi:hypothetical protein